MEVTSHFELEYKVPGREGELTGKASFHDIDAMRRFLDTARRDMKITKATFVRTSEKDILSCQDLFAFLEIPG